MTQNKEIISDKINNLISVLEGIPNKEIEEVIIFILNNRSIKHVLIFPNEEINEMQAQVNGVSFVTLETMFVSLLSRLYDKMHIGGCDDVKEH